MYLEITGKPDSIHRADFRLTDICNLLENDWEKLASELDIPPSDILLIKDEYPENSPQQAMIMFRLWLRQKANKATGVFPKFTDVVLLIEIPPIDAYFENGIYENISNLYMKIFELSSKVLF